MSHYPEPPQSENHYAPLYPSPSAATQLYDTSPQSQLQYAVPSIETYAKVEPGTGHIQQNLDQGLQMQSERIATPIQEKPDISQDATFLTTASSGSRDTPKMNRLRKACDSCSIRKVKCDESGPPCKACKSLDIPCTFQRPTRRRGPPNKHAEQLKRRKLEESGTSYSGASSPSSPTHAAQALAALSAQTSAQQLSAESICPVETLDLLINDFFAYIHPLCPFPHEPSFREAWKRREDLTNKSFLALLASMMGALVASFPRKPRLHLKAQRKEKLFPNHMSLVHRCQHVCALARGTGYLENENISVYDAATSYFLGLTGVYTFRWRQGRLYFGECLTIIRALGLHRSQEDLMDQSLGAVPTLYGSNDSANASAPMDYITIEIGRRIFWTMFVGVKTMQQLGATFGELQIPPPTPTEPYPALPLEVDDMCIYPDHIDAQPPTILPMLVGFNANVRAFSACNSISTMEMAWGIDHVVDWERQRRVLKEALRKCKDAVSSLPPELKVDLAAVPHPTSNGDGLYASFYRPSGDRDPAQSLLDLSRPRDDMIDQSPNERRKMQYEIQKANIYASSLATRSYIVQKFWNLMEVHARARQQQTPASTPNSPSVGIIAAGLDRGVPQPHHAPTSGFDMTEQEFKDERELIVKDLLIVLSSIDQVNMEPNADSFTMKIRSIASTLLDGPDSGRGHMEIQNKEYLAAFLDILMKLEKTSASTEADHAEDEATELRDWANLREYQVKFAQQGGAYGA